MKTSLPDLIYLKRLCKRLKSLLKLFGKHKSNSEYLTKQQTLAVMKFSLKPEKGLADFVRRAHNQARFIPELRTSDWDSAKFFLEMLLSLVQRQYAVILSGDIAKLKSVQKDLKDNNFYSMKRNNYLSWNDTEFEAMIAEFLADNNFDRDNDFENISDLPGKYLTLLDHYWKHKADISQTKLWYDFLVISAYMMYGTKLELLVLKKLYNR